jgi:hypothetical protein
MSGRQWIRRSADERLMLERAASTDAHATASRAVPDPASLHVSDTAARIDGALALQRTAGNGAVTTLVRSGATGDAPAPRLALGRRTPAAAGRSTRGHVATFKSEDAPGGLAAIRKRHGPSAIAHTTGKINGLPPMFRVEPGDDGKGGRTAKVRRTSTRPPDHDVELPGVGRHDVGAYGRFRHIIDINGDWAARLKVGEQEHVDDETIAWQVTWKVIADAINAVADGKPATGKTDDDAAKAAWSAVLGKLPGYLHPKDASETAQTARWDYVKGSPVKWLIDTSKRVRDVDAKWHFPTYDPEDPNTKGDMVDRPADGPTTKIPGKPAKDLLAEALKEAATKFAKP